MLRGGRSGEVRIKLYLCLSLVATKKPYDIKRVPSSVWAAMLDLPDPPNRGARRVADALNWLQVNQFVALSRSPGSPPTVTLLDPLGGGAKYTRPRGRWVTLPLGFWEQQWITHLSGTGVVMLLVLLDLQGGLKWPSDAPWLTGPERRRYGLSDDTWTRGTAELCSVGLLTVKRAPQGQDFDWRRLRNTYWVDKNKLNEGPP